MGYEIDFFPGGSGEKSGDAIAFRYGNLTGPREQQLVVIIDGGTKETGQQIVDHVKSYYNTDWVDLVVSTHPDADHASGLTVVLEQLRVRDALAMHLPWEHADDVAKMFSDGRLTAKGLEERVQKALQCARDLESLARKKNIRIIEPFAGVGGYGDRIRILGPSQTYYESLLPGFRCAPTGLVQKAVAAFQEVVRWVKETIDFSTETLTDPDDDATSAENNTSAILLLSVDGEHFLFTGDAGAPALLAAADYAAVTLGIDLTQLKFWQVPHHGSRRNVGPTVLSRIKAPVAYISAAPAAPKHPSKRVVNALIRRKTTVCATQGKYLLFHSPDSPNRGWEKVTPLQFSDQVEEQED